jgi:hypothetical protein
MLLPSLKSMRKNRQLIKTQSGCSTLCINIFFYSVIAMFTRNTYDPNHYEREVLQSTAPLEWALEPGQISHCQPCDVSYGSVPARNRFVAPKISRIAAKAMGVSAREANQMWSSEITDIESLLRQQHSQASSGERDGVYPRAHAMRDQLQEPVCSSKLTSESTLLTLPREHFRELGTDIPRMFTRERQATDFLDPRYAIDTRNQAKDSYVPKYPKPLDPNPTLPPAQRRNSYKYSNKFGKK